MLPLVILPLAEVRCHASQKYNDNFKEIARAHSRQRQTTEIHADLFDEAAQTHIKVIGTRRELTRRELHEHASNLLEASAQEEMHRLRTSALADGCGAIHSGHIPGIFPPAW